MTSEQLYHLYYSGMHGYDLQTEYKLANKDKFCSYCHRLKLPHGVINLIADGKVSKKADMMVIGNMLIPGVMSFRLLDKLGKQAEEHLHLGAVQSDVKGKIIKQKFITFVSKYEYVALRGENPDIIDGEPIPENNRSAVCSECGFKARRERAPWFLMLNEYPDHSISCTGMGLLIYESIYEHVKNLDLKFVRVQKVKIKNTI